jgi:hypothetical protein
MRRARTRRRRRWTCEAFRADEGRRQSEWSAGYADWVDLVPWSFWNHDLSPLQLCRPMLLLRRQRDPDPGQRYCRWPRRQGYPGGKGT